MTAQARTLIDRARDLAPTFRARAAQADRDRTLPAESVAEIRDAGFLRILQPRDNDGYALPPDVLWRVTCEIGRGCASTAWIVGLNGANVWLLSLFNETCRAEIFADGAQVLVPVLTGSAGRDVEVHAVSGGYKVSGSWRYASGIDYADWVAALVPLPDGPALAIFETDAFTVDHDSWHVLGMRGTGSKDIVLAETFLPRHRTLSWAAIQAGREHADPLYRLPANPFLAMSIAAPLIGTALGIVDALSETLGQRVAASANADADPRIYTTLGLCAAETDMAETTLYENSVRLYAAGTPSLAERARIRASTVVATRTALGAADRAVSTAGGALLPQGSALERGFRDIHAMASHFLLHPDMSTEALGRLRLNLPLQDGARI